MEIVSKEDYDSLYMKNANVSTKLLHAEAKIHSLRSCLGKVAEAIKTECFDVYDNDNCEQEVIRTYKIYDLLAEIKKIGKE